MKRNRLRLSCALLPIVMFAGCTSSASYRSLDQSAQGFEAAPSSSTTTFTTSRQEPPQTEAPAFQPKIIYTAELGLRVDRVDAVQEKAEAVATQYGGYLGESAPGRLVLRIPSEVFEVALDDLAALGEVTQRRVQAQDATERVVDLESRLRSAEVLRQRLIEMVKGAENIEHALKVEQELARVTDQIELMQGRLRLAQQQIAYATITLTIQATPEEHRLTPGIPITWVRELGNVFRERSGIDVTSPRRLRDGVDVELPEGFIRYYQEDYVTQAIDANGVRIRVRRFKNFDDGPLKFWQQLIARSLKDYGDLKLQQPSKIGFERGDPGQVLQGSKQMAGETVRYLIAVGVSEDDVYAYEVWGVAEHFDSISGELRQSIATMRCY